MDTFTSSAESGAAPVSTPMSSKQTPISKRLGLLVKFQKPVPAENRKEVARILAKTMKSDRNPMSVQLIAESCLMNFLPSGQLARIQTAPNCTFDAKSLAVLKQWGFAHLVGLDCAGFSVLGIKAGTAEAMDEFLKSALEKMERGRQSASPMG